MNAHVLFFDEVDRSRLLDVGGKGANLGELSKAGFSVPEGFCVTTAAYKDFIATSSDMDGLLDELYTLDRNDLERLRKLGEWIRTHLLQLEIPTPIKNEIIKAWKAIGTHYAYAVRSSATAEDLPTASFAGQQDTYLNIRGEKELLRHIHHCWASLFTDRAIAYRGKNGFDHRQVYLSVVVQRMVQPEIAGIMFTADPANGNRKVVSIDASYGLGEAIVSGIVSADLYKVKTGEIIQKNVSEKKKGIYALPEGGTITKDLPKEQQKQQTLTDEQIRNIARLGKQIEDHFGSPQDVEFCVEKGKVYVVQSRPITSLYPLPDIRQEPLQVLFSFGHFQMMTDAIKPLGISVIKTFVPFPKQYIQEAGGRLYVDLSEILRHKIGRKIFPKIMINMDEAASRAIGEVIQRPEFLAIPSKLSLQTVRPFLSFLMKEVWKNLFKRDPAAARGKVEAYMQQTWTDLRESLLNVSGAKRLEVVQSELLRFFKGLIPNVGPNILSFFLSAMLLKKLLIRWLGDDKELHQLNKSLSGNITSEMGLQIGDLADLLREFPEVEAYVKTADDRNFYHGLADVPDGEQFQRAFANFISTYGSRCPGEIDLTRPRWREAPTQLIPAILGHMRSVEPGEHRQKFIQGEQEAKAAEQRILERLQGNRFKYKVMKRLIKVYRYYGGLREHHKYLLTLILDECKQAILTEAEDLVQKGILPEVEDAYYLTLEEMIQLAKGQLIEEMPRLLAERKEKHEWHQTLRPPRVMTSEGESVTVSRTGEFPAGALVGSPVSAGVVEGKARIVLKPEEAQLHQGEILVAPHTDPGWTPLFQSAQALVTEVGGLMTHGSVVAREYGIPAVVGVDDATKMIRQGQRIRVDGNQGYVEVLSDGE